MTLSILRSVFAGALVLLVARGTSSPARAQQEWPASATGAAEIRAPATDLDSLVSYAVAVSPSIPFAPLRTGSRLRWLQSAPPVRSPTPCSW